MVGLARGTGTQNGVVPRLGAPGVGVLSEDIVAVAVPVAAETQIQTVAGDVSEYAAYSPAA
jgi:hypothetical protein